MTNTSRRYKIAVGLVWAAALIAGGIWAYAQQVTVAEIIGWIYHNAREHPLAPVFCIALYAIRPVTLLPAMWLTIACGSLFGFWPGLLWAAIGENLSAVTAYAIARFFRSPGAEKNKDTIRELSSFRRTLEEHTIPTLIVLRAAYLPFDLINFGCGLLRIPWRSYLIGSFIGLFPPMITYVSFGATINFDYLVHNMHGFDATQLFDMRQLAISLGLAGASVVIVLLAHRYSQRLARSAD